MNIRGAVATNRAKFDHVPVTRNGGYESIAQRLKAGSRGTTFNSTIIGPTGVVF